MKHVKILSIAAIALAALLVAPGSASATILTSPAGTTYTGNIVAESSNLTMTSPFGFGTLTCGSSKLEGKVEKHGGSVTVAMSLSLLTFSSCTGGEFTSPVVKRGSLEFHGTSTTGNGTVTWLNAEMIMHKTLLGTCRFTTSSAGTDLGTLTGSNVTKGNAVLDISGVIPGTCGSSTWEGNFKVTTPNTLEVH